MFVNYISERKLPLSGFYFTIKLLYSKLSKNVLKVPYLKCINVLEKWAVFTPTRFYAKCFRIYSVFMYIIRNILYKKGGVLLIFQSKIEYFNNF